MAHKVVITQSTAGRSGPPQTMLDVLEEAGIGMCKQRSGSTYFLAEQRCKS